jgi:hypothetical protein
MAAYAVIILLNGNDPFLGAFGSDGAKTLTEAGTVPDAVQSNTKGCVVSEYRKFPGGGGANRPIPQLTASGMTVVGGAEKAPVAVNCTRPPFTVWLIVMD